MDHISQSPSKQHYSFIFQLTQGLVVKPIFIVISVSFKFLFRATSGAYPTEMQCAAVSICQALIMVPMEFCIKARLLM